MSNAYFDNFFFEERENILMSTFQLKNHGGKHAFYGSEIRAANGLVTDIIKSATGGINIRAVDGVKINNQSIMTREPALILELTRTENITLAAGATNVTVPANDVHVLTGDIETWYHGKKGLRFEIPGLYELTSILPFDKVAGGGSVSSHFEYNDFEYGHDICRTDENDPGILKNRCILNYVDTNKSVTFKASNTCVNSVTLIPGSYVAAWRWTVKYLGQCKDL